MQSILCRIPVQLPLGAPTAKIICIRGSGGRQMPAAIVLSLPPV